jgi:hypothetical protein
MDTPRRHAITSAPPTRHHPVALQVRRLPEAWLSTCGGVRRSPQQSLALPPSDIADRSIAVPACASAYSTIFVIGHGLGDDSFEQARRRGEHTSQPEALDYARAELARVLATMVGR